RVLAQALAGDPVAGRAVHTVARWLARGVASLVNVFNPELVVFGGPLSGVYLAAEDVVRSELSRLALGPSWQRVRLAVPELGADSMVLGAAELAFERLLGDPLDEPGPRGGGLPPPVAGATPAGEPTRP
ncbi:MAG: ROK family protein, partial [Actinomycetes bacterium]